VGLVGGVVTLNSMGSRSRRRRMVDEAFTVCPLGHHFAGLCIKRDAQKKRRDPA
jgi:hypothetical protein